MLVDNLSRIFKIGSCNKMGISSVGLKAENIRELHKALRMVPDTADTKLNSMGANYSGHLMAGKAHWEAMIRSAVNKRLPRSLL
jgi:hypothetical protein